MIPANLHSLWADLLMHQLAVCGTTEVVISPGSRSTPLVLAAAGNSEMRCHPLLDERVAGFFGLGLARATHRPVALVCTSGSALAHYAPAVIEASESHTPLLVLTADRPFELQQRQAPQTTDQRLFFGRHVRAAFDLGPPDPDPRTLRGLAATSALAWARTLDPHPGPVHLNLSFRKPLEPVSPNAADAALREEIHDLFVSSREPFHPPVRHPAKENLEALAAACQKTRAGLILCGPGPLSQREALPALSALSTRLGFPVLAEAASQFSFVRQGERPRLLAVPFTGLCPSGPDSRPGPPELIIQLGAPLTSGSWNQWLASPGAPLRWVVSPFGWNDPHHNAQGVIAADLRPALEELLPRLAGHPPPDPEWGTAWVTAARLAASDPSLDLWCEAAAARIVIENLPAGSLLALGNSLSIREVDRLPPPEIPLAGVLSQRGVNGIDGNISSAAGAAVGLDCPVTLITGDQAAQHDLSGLAAARLAGSRLRVIILNNSGGRMFERLPLAASGIDPQVFRDFFLMPQNLDFHAAARAFGVDYQRATGPSELRSILASPPGRGPQMVDVRLCAS